MTTTNSSRESSGVLLSRPQDESLESYKAWIAELFERISGNPMTPEKDMSEQAWRERHAEFWRKMHASHDEAGE